RFGDDPLIAFRNPPGAVDGVGVRRLDAGLPLAVEAHAHRAHERQRNEQDHPEQTDADPAEKRACRPVASDPPGHGSPLLWRARLEDNLCGAIKQIRLRRVNRGLWLLIAYRSGMNKIIVIARSEATKQSRAIPTVRCPLDCFASLAMTLSIGIIKQGAAT